MTTPQAQARCGSPGGLLIWTYWSVAQTLLYRPNMPKCKKADFMLSIHPPGLTGLFHRHMLECPGAGDVSPESSGHPRPGVSILGISPGVRSSSLQYPAVPLSYSSQADNPQQVLVRSVPASLINNTGNWVVASDYGRFFPAHVGGVLY